MRPQKSLQRAQQAMRRRQRTGRGPRRPRLPINKDQVQELLLKGYLPRGVTIALGCSRRTLQRCFSHLLRTPLNPAMSGGSVLFKLAVQEHNLRALLYLGEQLAEEDARRAAAAERRAEQKKKRKKFNGASERNMSEVAKTSATLYFIALAPICFQLSNKYCGPVRANRNENALAPAADSGVSCLNFLLTQCKEWKWPVNFAIFSGPHDFGWFSRFDADFGYYFLN